MSFIEDGRLRYSVGSDATQETLLACRQARHHQWPSGLSSDAFANSDLPAETCESCGTTRERAARCPHGTVETDTVKCRDCSKERMTS